MIQITNLILFIFLFLLHIAAHAEENLSQIPPLDCTRLISLPTIEDSDSAIAVGQREYCIRKFNEGEEVNALKTSMANPCVGLACYNSQFKIGVLAHFDPMSDAVLSIKKISLSLPGSMDLNNEGWKVYIFPRDRFSDHKIIADLMYSFEELRGIPISNWGFNENIWLDLSNGELYTYKTNPELETSKNVYKPYMPTESELINGVMLPLKEWGEPEFLKFTTETLEQARPTSTIDSLKKLLKQLSNFDFTTEEMLEILNRYHKHHKHQIPALPPNNDPPTK